MLLFNIASLIEDRRSTVRFQFDSFKTEAWDIEHVRSVASDRLQNHREQTEWLRHSLEVLKAVRGKPKLCKKIESHLGQDAAEASEEEFASLYRDIVKHFKEDTEENDHSVANLVLLDRVTNRSYKNSVFAAKRQRLLSLDRGWNISFRCAPAMCFLKCYSDHGQHLLFWSQSDRMSYQDAIIKTLIGFFAKGWEV